MIGCGIVAEKSRVCRFCGTFFKINSMSSRNPMSSIWSASSSTTVATSLSASVRRSRWSMTRPGVPITIWTPWWSARSWRSIGWPPYTGSTTIRGMCARRFENSSAIWIASSRVGQSTIACTTRFEGSIFSMMGIPNAAVFPVPVCAWAVTSRPAWMRGMASAWMGEGSSKPISSMAFPTSFDRLKSENCIREFISHHHLVCELIRWRTETGG